MNFFQFDSRIEYFFNMTQELNPFSFSRNMTQRMELFFKKWLIELIFFECDSKKWTSFFWHDSKNWTFSFWYDSKTWTFSSGMTQRLELFFSEMTQRIEPFPKIRLKELNFFSVWLKELNFFIPLTELNFFVKCDPNDWNFFWIRRK